MQVAPTRAAADVALLDFARTLQLGDLAILHRRAGLLTCARCRQPLGLLLGLVFGFLDKFIERFDDAFLDALHAFARAALSEPAANIVHAARNVVERIVFQPARSCRIRSASF